MVKEGRFPWTRREREVASPGVSQQEAQEGGLWSLGQTEELARPAETSSSRACTAGPDTGPAGGGEHPVRGGGPREGCPSCHCPVSRRAVGPLEVGAREQPGVSARRGAAPVQ